MISLQQLLCLLCHKRPCFAQSLKIDLIKRQRGKKHLFSCYLLSLYPQSNMWPRSLKILLKLGLVCSETGWSNSNELPWLLGQSAELTAAQRAKREYDWWISAHRIPVCPENTTQSVNYVLWHVLFLVQVLGSQGKGKQCLGCLRGCVDKHL